MIDEVVLTLAARIAAQLGGVAGVAAVALGGSQARGTASAGSDIDIALYYEPDSPLDVAALRTVARALDPRPEAAVTEPGAWGPWVNGGAWLVVDGRRVDWLYRDLTRVRATLADCRAGRITCDYQAGHPHGFHNHMYVAETVVCHPLHDPRGVLAALKVEATPYPEPLRRAIIRTYLWEAAFSLEIAAKGAARADVAYVAGCLYRCAACLVQVLFALNRVPFLNEKAALALAATFPLLPGGFCVVVEWTLAALGVTGPHLNQALSWMAKLTRDVAQLVEDNAPGVALPFTRIVPEG